MVCTKGRTFRFAIVSGHALSLSEYREAWQLDAASGLSSTATMKFRSPQPPNDDYTLTVTVLNENWQWVEKSGRDSGSSGYFVSIHTVVLND